MHFESGVVLFVPGYRKLSRSALRTTSSFRYSTKTPKSTKNRGNTLNPDSPSPLINSDAMCYPVAVCKGAVGPKSSAVRENSTPGPAISVSFLSRWIIRQVGD